ncbi:MAG: hypothetical protein GPJ51_02440 [Candidatus Heimdallarchaeota archaeon]|nr:hypothetical protein [Candidatus Heimdallarchaeota archaeon]
MSSTAGDADSIDDVSENEEELTEEEGKNGKKKKDRKFVFVILSVLITIVSVGTKFAIIIYDILIPKALRDYVPFLNMVRKIALPISEILAGKKSKEISEVANELDELDLNKEKVMKAYPLRRTIGQALSMGISPLILIVIPTIIWGEDLIDKIQDIFPLLPSWLIFVLLGTIMLMLSWVVTLFGPLYVIFHNSSKYMLKLGAYRWASFFQDLENLFAVPYLAAKSSFSFFDAPPISSETLQEFKLDIKDEIDTVKQKVEGLLALDAKNVPDRSKEQLEKLLKKIEIPIEQLDLAKITDSTSRTFALLIWSKESSILPWRRKEALERFAIKNNLTNKEVEEAFLLLNKKRKEEDIPEETVKSILVTGALKGIQTQETKYKQIMSDIEANKLAIALALGTEQYLEDVYSTLPRVLKIFKAICLSILAILMPFFLIILAILLYIKHVLFSLIKTIFSKDTLLMHKYIGKRYREIKTTLVETYQSVKAKGKKFNFKEDVDIDFKGFFMKLGKGFLLLILALLKLAVLWPLWKSLYIRIAKVIASRKPEAKMKRRFEKELTTESLVFMFQEVYDNIVVG